MNDYRMVVRRTGGPDVIEREDIAMPQPGAGEAIVRNEAIGLNFIDAYQRSGLYPVELPSGLGSEAAGTVEAVGAGVTDFRPGDRVVSMGGPLGAYASVRAIDAAHLIPVPDGIGLDVAAASLLKGLTVDMLVGDCGKAKPGDVVLVHSAAGGVGAIAVQWLKAIGAIVIAHAGSDAKARKAEALGADHVLACSYDRLANEVRRATDGHGADLVLDGVGKDSWSASLASLARRGLLVTYGNASGPVPPFSPLDLRKGSLFVTRPAVFDYIETRERLLAAVDRLFGHILAGRITIEIGQRLPLGEAGSAHEALETRKTTGSTILVP